MKKIQLRVFSLASIIMLMFSSCAAIRTAPFDQYSYQRAVEIKVDASRLMDKAVTPYKNHSQEIEELFVDLEKIVAYEQNKPNNEISYKMWKLLVDEDKNLLAGFFKKWNESDNGKMRPVFANEAKSQVIEAMNILIQYEGKKDKESENGLMRIILGNQ